MTLNVKVHEVSVDLLPKIARQLLREEAASVSADKAHFKYFAEYLADISAQTAVVEEPYIDQHFLEDYAGYYVRCFTEYKKTCARIHFFSEKFSEDEFRQIVLCGTAGRADAVAGAYLGFIVLRPLPSAFFGRTCLTTYDGSSSRCFPILRAYDVSLCGLSLKVSSLAFQEQDTVTAACATSALWTAFHGTGKLFQHKIPSPVDITKMASDLGSSRPSRILPNDGLNAQEMANAIQAVGLEPFLVSTRDLYVFKATVYAYIKAKIPIILGADIHRIDALNNLIPDGHIGKHATALTGYRLDVATPISHCGRLPLMAQSLSRMYAHDDQVGPFSKLHFDKAIMNAGGQSIEIDCLRSSGWAGCRLIPEMVVIPLYHKIRVPFEGAHRFADDFTNFSRAIMTMVLQANGQPIPASGLPHVFSWDIFLSTANDLKECIRSQDFDGADKSDVLFSHFPKYVWRCIGYVANVKSFEIVLDATDFAHGKIFQKLIVYEQDVKQFLSLLAHVVSASPGIIPSGKRAISDLLGHVCAKYGVSALAATK